jgi:hypothetical protein
MCTLSFVPKVDGFLIAMNRDEQRSRPKALPPALHRHGNMSALHPSEPTGGTWIGINEAGLCIALINWYSRPQYIGKPAFSRGEIIPRLLACTSRNEAETILRSFPLDRLNPFRLFVIGEERLALREYRSDGNGLEGIDHPWIPGHWFSSGHDEPSATEVRGTVCRQAAEKPDQGTLPWLVQLHSSHDPAKGAESVCMHREDAVTVSLTTMDVSRYSVTVDYRDGSPCTSPGKYVHSMTLPVTFRIPSDS